MSAGWDPISSICRSIRRPIGVIRILAHLGGIDEIGVFLVGVALAGLVLWWIERRTRHRNHVKEDDTSNSQDHID